MTAENPNCLAREAPLSKAQLSATATETEDEISVATDPNTLPVWSRIIDPKPNFFCLLHHAASELTFTTPTGGAFQGIATPFFEESSFL